MIITPEKYCGGIRYWADHSPTRFPLVEIYVYHGRGDDGLFYFHKRGQPNRLIGKALHELNSMYFYPFLIDPERLREIEGEVANANL
jgi:hypothetical protein